MAEVTSAMVKDLREKTGAGMMDCKKALLESGGDVEKAITWLREKGLATAGKKAGRSATEGAVGSYIHLGGKIGVLVEVNCETDFTARNEKFQALVKDVAMQIAWSDPEWVRREDVPADELDKEKSAIRGELREQGKPEAMWEKILPGKLEKFYAKHCLLDQAFFRDPDGKRRLRAGRGSDQADEGLRRRSERGGHRPEVRPRRRFVRKAGPARRERQGPSRSRAHGAGHAQAC